MYQISQARTFRRALRKLKKSGTLTSGVAADFTIAINTLREGKSLPARYRDHALSGEFKGYRECHIRGDLLLIYQRDDSGMWLDLVDIGSHSYLFG